MYVQVFVCEHMDIVVFIVSCLLLLPPLLPFDLNKYFSAYHSNSSVVVVVVIVVIIIIITVYILVTT